MSGPPMGPSPNSYMKVNVLLLSWKDMDDPAEGAEFKAQLCLLSDEFKAYRFVVEEYEIESDMPYRKLSERLIGFLRHHDKIGTLLILYYGGHGLNNRDSHCVWLRLVTSTPDIHLMLEHVSHCAHARFQGQSRGFRRVYQSWRKLEHVAESLPRRLPQPCSLPAGLLLRRLIRQNHRLDKQSGSHCSGRVRTGRSAQGLRQLYHVSHTSLEGDSE